MEPLTRFSPYDSLLFVDKDCVLENDISGQLECL